jgi:P2X purinoceptor 4
VAQWCPAENVTVNNTVLPDSVSQQFSIVTADDLTIWMKATMSFPSLDATRNYSTVYQQAPIKAPDPHQNTFTLRELLHLTQTQYSDIIMRGCILLVKLHWECYMSDDLCQPTVSAMRLDNASLPTGFNFRMPSYYRDPQTNLVRDLFKYTGVRIFFVSEGIGYMVSVPTIVLQLSSGLAMLTIATVVTDFVMEYIMPQRKRYSKYKFLEVRARGVLCGFAAT